MLRRGAVIVGVGALTMMLTTGGRAASSTPTGYDTFAMSALAQGITAHFSVTGFLPTGIDSFDVSTAFAQSELHPTLSTSVAAFPYPSDALLSVPGLVAGLLTLPNVPPYPLAARAQDPLHPDASAADVGAVGATAVQVSAHADPTKATATASLAGTSDRSGVLAGFQIPGLPLKGGLFAIGSAQTVTTDRKIDDVTFDATAISTLADVSLLGGAIHIGQVRSVAHVELSKGHATSHVDPVMLSEVTLAGVPIGIDEHGLALGPTAQALSPVADAANAAMHAAGLAVRLTPATRHASGLSASANAGSVVIELKSVYQGYPVDIALSLGGATASVEVSGPFTGTTGGTPATIATDSGGSGGAQSTAAPAPASDLGGSNPASPILSGPLASALPTTGSSRATQPIVASRIDFRPAYPWLALLGIAAFALRRWLARTAPVDRATTHADLRDLWRW